MTAHDQTDESSGESDGGAATASGRPVDETVTWRQLWAETTEVLDDRSAARWLCEAAGSFDDDELLRCLDEPATERMVAHLDAMVARHRAGEPLQYALGRWAFRHLDVMVDRRVLIPRPETEIVVETALSLVGRRPVLAADLGTGSGVIGLSLAAELPRGTTVWLTDVSSDALDVARANLAGLGRAAANVRVAEGSWFDALPDEVQGRLDLVVSNPPYIAVDDAEVEDAVRDWEPHVALFAGADGLDAYREIAVAAPRWLAPGGWLVLEIGHTQSEVVADLLRDAGLADVAVHPDLAGHPRVATARAP
jgi:release factor glutamine methyltransferase